MNYYGAPARKTGAAIIASGLALLMAHQALAGLPANFGTRQPSSWGGGFSPASFQCTAVPGEGTTNVITKVRTSGESYKAVFSGKVDCTNTDNSGNIVPTPPSPPKRCEIKLTYKNGVQQQCLVPGQAGFPQAANGYSSVLRTYMTCDDVTSSADIEGFISCPADSFDTCMADDIDGTEGDEDCGVRFGIIADKAEESVCRDIFGSAPLLDIPLAFPDVSDCGAGSASSTSGVIDFENQGNNERDPVNPIVEPSTGVTTTFRCIPDHGTPADCQIGSDSNECFYVLYGPDTTAFVPDDKPNPDTNVGHFGLSDDCNGPKETDEFQMLFSRPIRDLSIDVIDFRADGGAHVGDVVTFTGFSDGSLAQVVDSASYKIPGDTADGQVVTLSISGSNIVAANITTTTGDVGMALDNLRITERTEELPTQVLTATSRACAGPSIDSQGNAIEGFVSDPTFDPDRDCNIPEKGELPETSGVINSQLTPEPMCLGKFTRRACGANKPTIKIGPPFLRGKDVVKRSVEIDGPGFSKFNCKGNSDYACRATCDIKQYKAAKAAADENGMVLATLTGLTKQGDDFVAACMFQVD